MNKEDYSKYYIQGSDHYLIPKDVFIELFNEMNNWKEESKELNQKYLNAVVDYEITMSDKTELEKQLEYLRSGEYLNQLKFERNMLEDIVQNSGVSKEDKEFIDMTHRNTELLEENQQLKKEYNEAIHKATEFEIEVYELQQENQELKDRIGKTIEYIEKDTRWFDSEYASIYGTLCTCAGAKDNRLEVMVNPSNLLKILKGDEISDN